MGLEILVLSDTLDAYSSAFDKARRCARFGEGVVSWEVAYGRYPRREDLVKSKRFDNYGPLETRQIYQYEMGCMQNGEGQIMFIYIDHCYAYNLSNSSLREFVRQFNLANEFQMEIGSGLMIPKK